MDGFRRFRISQGTAVPLTLNLGVRPEEAATGAQYLARPRYLPDFTARYNGGLRAGAAVRFRQL